MEALQPTSFLQFGSSPPSIYLLLTHSPERRGKCGTWYIIWGTSSCGSFIQGSSILTIYPPPPPFPSFRKTEKIYQVKINKTMLHTLPHEWKKQAVMLGFDFGDETLRYVLEQFKLMKLKEKIWKCDVALLKWSELDWKGPGCLRQTRVDIW